MFSKKNKYFLLIENIKDIDLKNIKIRKKFSIIYRNISKSDNYNDLLKFRRRCKLKAIKFYIANNKRLAVLLNSDGIYLSSHNKSLNSLIPRRKASISLFIKSVNPGFWTLTTSSLPSISNL